MSWSGRVTRRLRVLLHKDVVESELAEEVRLHLEMEADALVQQGWDRRAGPLGFLRRQKALPECLKLLTTVLAPEELSSIET